jgi:hypothetical protein
MTEVEKRIEQLERRAAEASLLAKLASDPAKQTYNVMFAEDLLALAKTLRTPGSQALVT